MKRIYYLSAALAALVSVSACSSSGRANFGGDLTGSPQAAPRAPSNNGANGGSENPGGGGGGGGGDGGQFDEAFDPLGRVTVVDAPIIDGDDEEGALGLSVASDTQQRGDLLSLGVLQDGQVIAANDVSQSGDLIGAVAGDHQLIGEGDSQQVSVDLLTPGDSEGDLIGVDVLAGGQIVDVEVNGSESGLVENLTSPVADLLKH